MGGRFRNTGKRRRQDRAREGKRDGGIKPRVRETDQEKEEAKERKKEEKEKEKRIWENQKHTATGLSQVRQKQIVKRKNGQIWGLIVTVMEASSI